ncbi:hypothetical protein ACIFOE_12925 [Paenibacillus sp. NRS-1783]|uniref:hypothetical protein n=1 Tax=Paenibacillus sp. NRS-1783 TaxID=3233907 RepID=UPI003D26F595
MTARILSCGDSKENYYRCIENSVAGFKKRFAQINDLVYFSVKADSKESYCGARGVVLDAIDFVPWAGAEDYLYWYRIGDIEFCKPFQLKVLSVLDNWSLRFMQLPKPINDEIALSILDENFMKGKQENLFVFESTKEKLEQEVDQTKKNSINNSDINLSNSLDIMGTFKTVNFISETHKIKGLEPLVTKNFYKLFGDEYPEAKTILIPFNRIFKTSNKDANDNKVNGISGIPDGLLISFNNSQSSPLQINIIEYECYGETKQRSVQRFNYLNGHIIPQLIRFASAFSIVTDNKIRDENIRDWVDKIIDYVEQFELGKVSDWLYSFNPDMPERRHVYEFEKLLIDAFRKALKILLIIDDLSTEQKETIKNVISSFKLEEGKHIEFIGYSVQLVEKIDVGKLTAEYALTIQK